MDWLGIAHKKAVNKNNMALPLQECAMFMVVWLSTIVNPSNGEILDNSCGANPKNSPQIHWLIFTMNRVSGGSRGNKKSTKNQIKILSSARRRNWRCTGRIDCQRAVKWVLLRGVVVMFFLAKLFDAKIKGTPHNGNNTAVYGHIGVCSTTAITRKSLCPKLCAKQ